MPKTRVVLFEAAVAAANGLVVRRGAGGDHDRRRASSWASTSASARSKPGKDGDLALYDGDPFEYTTHCTGVVIEGEVVSRDAR